MLMAVKWQIEEILELYNVGYFLQNRNQRLMLGRL